MAALRTRRKSSGTEFEYGIHWKDLVLYYLKDNYHSYHIVILVPILYIFSLSLRARETVYQDFLFLIPKAVTTQNYFDAAEYATSILMFLFFNVSQQHNYQLFINLCRNDNWRSCIFQFQQLQFKGKNLRLQ